MHSRVEVGRVGQLDPDFGAARVDVNLLVALERGPLVYCAEAADNGGSVLALAFPDDAPIEVAHRVASGLAWTRPVPLV